jgi:hypothetical protein
MATYRVTQDKPNPQAGNAEAWSVKTMSGGVVTAVSRSYPTRQDANVEADRLDARAMQNRRR